MDFDGLSMKQVMGLSPSFSMRLLTFIQDAMPLRLKEVRMKLHLRTESRVKRWRDKTLFDVQLSIRFTSWSNRSCSTWCGKCSSRSSRKNWKSVCSSTVPKWLLFTLTFPPVICRKITAANCRSWITPVPSGTRPSSLSSRRLKVSWDKRYLVNLANDIRLTQSIRARSIDKTDICRRFSSEKKLTSL